MKLDLITLSGVQKEGDVYEVIIPTSTGEIAVFPGHEPLVSIVKAGAVMVRRQKGDSDNQLEIFAVSGGVAEISQEAVRILVDTAIGAEEITEDESRAALERAIEMRKNATDQIELDKAHQLVDRHSVRLKVAELRRRHRG